MSGFKVGDNVKLVDDIQWGDCRSLIVINSLIIEKFKYFGIIEVIDDEHGVHRIQSKDDITSGTNGWWIDENVLELVEGVDE